MIANPPAIQIDHLTCRFRGGADAVDDFSWSVPAGTVCGLVGVNGAGKTTLLRHLIGALRPQHGTVRVLGQDPTVSPEALLQRIGWVAEEDQLPGWMRVGELCDFLRSLYRDWDPDLCGELLTAFRLDLRQRLRDLSKGGRARMSLVAAIAHRPELLILDEPSYGLDWIARGDILETVVRTAGQEQRTVLFSSHLLDEVARVCDHVALIHQGRLIESIPVDRLYQRYQEWVFAADPRDVRAAIDRPADNVILAGAFGWQRMGDEWSMVIDRDRIPADMDEPAVADSLQRSPLSAKYPLPHAISLERWFAARVDATQAETSHVAGVRSAADPPEQRSGRSRSSTPTEELP